MQCGRCGATLRDNAKFCNVCGAAQPASETSQPGASDTSTERLKRPERPLRPTDEFAFLPRPAPPPTRPTAKLGSASAAGGGFASEFGAAQEAGESPASAQETERREIADQPTYEYAVITPTTGSHAIDAGGVPPPWPLPIGDVLEGRYRVESVAEAAPDAPGAENVYHVVDLLGYERCWSCGTQHGREAQGERFCPQCGADMIGHEYLMIEHREETEHDTRPEMPSLSESEGAQEPERVFERMGRRYQVAEIERETTRFPFGPHVTVAGASHVGLTRAGETNEDSFGALAVNLGHDSQRQPLAIAIVADGLGGHASGQDASRLAVRIFIERLTQELALPLVAPRGSTLPPDEAVASALHDAAQAANDAIFQVNTQGGGDSGSTLVALVIVGEMAWIANVGDSRAYVMDGDSLRRVTSDHSVVEQLILSGMVTPEERYTHPQRNRIFRSLGSEEQVELDVFTQRLRPGMRLLLCSDGLWEMTRDPEIEQILRETPYPVAACAALIASANEHGGEDNITAVVAQIDA
ncbi:MAG TPA: protein phosphatase 2C domain-containing protein [Ktedonobacterales bacterium]